MASDGLSTSRKLATTFSLRSSLGEDKRITLKLSKRQVLPLFGEIASKGRSWRYESGLMNRRFTFSSSSILRTSAGNMCSPRLEQSVESSS